MPLQVLLLLHEPMADLLGNDNDGQQQPAPGSQPTRSRNLASSPVPVPAPAPAPAPVLEKAEATWPRAQKLLAEKAPPPRLPSYHPL